MNYLAEVLRFTDFILMNKLSTGQIALWYALIAANNKQHWDEWFTIPNQTLEQMTGLSRNGINVARNVLMQKGLISFKTNGTKATSYHIHTMSNIVQDSSQDCVQNSGQDSVQDSVQNSGTLYKQNKTNINQTDLTDNVFGYYERVFCTVLTRTAMEELESYLADGMEATLVMAVFDEAVERGKGNWRYARAILNNLRGEGVKSFSAYRSRFLMQKQQKAQEEKSDISVYVPYHVRRENHA